jgi:hypothetical protein
LKAEGHTIFAYSDEYLVGYSSLLSQYDTIQYIGEPLQVNPIYGCSEKLAFFLTTERLYVFDAELGTWQKYAYGLPPDYDGAGYCVAEDYVVVSISRPGQRKDVVYSQHTHSFSQLAQGPRRCYLDHGFVSVNAYPEETGHYRLVGYSAYINQFVEVQVRDQGYLCSGGGGGGSGLKAGEFTAYAVSFRQCIPNVSVQAVFYGYDTRRGYWSHITKDFGENEGYSGSGQTGGQFVVDRSISGSTSAYTEHYIIYSGLTGQFSTIPHELHDNFILPGGTVFVVADPAGGNAWGYDLVTEQGATIPIDGEHTRSFPMTGEDYATFARWSDDSDTMTVYFYNSRTNNWTTTPMPKVTSSGGDSSNEHIFVFTSFDSPTRETIFYSSVTDSYKKCQFLAESHVYQGLMSETLAYTRSNEESYLFDAQTGAIHKLNFGSAQYSMGDYSASFVETDTKTLYGYSTLSRQWTTLTIDDTPYTCGNKGFIGLISSNVGTQTYKKYYAYNGLKDSWVELVPTGSYKVSLVGGKTALVLRSDRLYAFDPDGRATEDTTPPPAIVNLSAIPGDNQIILGWDQFEDKDGDFDHFNIYREESPITDVAGLTPIDQSITDSTVTAYIDTSALSDTPYYYAVTAVDEAGNENKAVAGVGPVRWQFPGDVTGDGKVDDADLDAVADAFNTKEGDEGWNPAADLNNDGIVDIFDLVIVGINFGKDSSP